MLTLPARFAAVILCFVVRPVVETADCAVQAAKGRWVGRH